MAQSRLERIGTIFSRITSLMKGGALKPIDRPLWYDVYKAFPPKEEPTYNRAAPNIAIRDIFYKEDIIRAKFQKEYSKSYRNNLLSLEPSSTQKFIAIYQDLEKAGVPEEKLYENAVEVLKERDPQFQQFSSRRDIQPQLIDNTNKQIDKLFKM